MTRFVPSVALLFVLWVSSPPTSASIEIAPEPSAPGDAAAAEGTDCNGNGIPDATDIENGTSADCNRNGVPDECDTFVEFAQHPVTNLTDAPQTVFAADLDGDSDLDLLSASFDDDKLAWYENLDGQGTFGAQHVISIGAFSAVTVIAADLDADGDADVLVTSAADDKITWFPNDGNAGFVQAKVITDQADGVWSIQAIDIDGDGDLDVLSSSQNDNKIAWYPNQGLGLFGAQRIVSVQADEAVSAVGADIDGDGDVDVVSASFGDDKIAWYENSDGAGSFGAQQVIDGEASGASKVDVADLDGDGDLDVVAAATFDNQIAWYEKLDGIDDFGPRRVIASNVLGAVYVAVGDPDGDGDIDVMSASFSDSTVAWYENVDGNGNFGAPHVVTDVAFGATSVIAADLDGDGDEDFVQTSQSDNTVAWQENLGDDCDGDGVPDECESDCNANGRIDECDLAVGESGDCNGNVIPDECDIAQGSSVDCAGEGVPDECEPDCNGNLVADSCDIDSGTSVDCVGEGIPDECEPDCNGNAVADSCDIAAATSEDCALNGIPDECEPDCNGNADADSCDLRFGVSPDCNGNQVPDECDAGSTSLDCDADGVPDECETSIEFTEHVISTLVDFPRAVYAADLDSDGDADVLSASALDDKIAWYENTDGGGTFGPQRIISTGADLVLSVFASDLDGDRDPDVLSASFSDDKIAWYENAAGLGDFGPQRIVSNTADGAISVFAADLDGDTDIDVLSAAFLSGEIAWYENLDGLGGFGSAKPISGLEPGAFAVSAADVDGDLDADVLVASFDDDSIAWYENLDGSDGFGPRTLITTSADGATSVLGIDLDADSDIDIVSASQNDDTVAWYENLDGSGSFGPAQSVSAVANGATGVFAADVNGDGRADILSASFFDSRIAWYENEDGLGAFGPTRIVSTHAIGAYSVFACDFDGDGDLDVVSASQDDDKIAWYENESDDCNGNGIPDGCDVAGGASDDCAGDGVPDECESDCNGNGTADSCDILTGTSIDCDLDSLPDECEADCNGNGVADGCDIAGGASLDCNENLVPDECDADCNANSVADECDIAGGASQDCNLDGIPDECEPDCNGNGSPDDCDVAQGAEDCNGNLLPDECDADCNEDGTPDDCDSDCNANEVPDGCEPDCNANGIADECDIDPGPSIDCNANGVPDECDDPCPANCDADGDRCRDGLDSDPDDPVACADVDADGCDDCSSGVFNPAFDGTDADHDGICAIGDCDDTNAVVWSDPGPARSLVLGTNGGIAALTWQPPSAPGANLLFYDTLRSPAPEDFVTPATCLESNQVDTAATDAEVPPAGAGFHYLIRVRNDCPGGNGTLGEDSSGAPRTGLACP